MIACDSVFEKEQDMIGELSGGKLRMMELRLMLAPFWLFCCTFVFFFE